MKTENCRICGKECGKLRVCGDCAYLIRQGASEETIKKMLSDDATNKVWAENKGIADELADAYYGTVLEDYKNQSKRDSKENLGYNTFAEGINLALDIMMPLLDEDSQQKVKAKISAMVALRKEHEKRRKA